MFMIMLSELRHALEEKWYVYLQIPSIQDDAEIFVEPHTTPESTSVKEME